MARSEFSRGGLVQVLLDIVDERRRQDELHGVSNAENGPAEWLTVLAEEFGEAAKEACEMRYRPTERARQRLRKELIETASVAVAWVERIDKAGPCES